MLPQRTVTCTNIQHSKNMITITYKIGRHTNMMSTFRGEPDFDTAKTLNIGDKFIIEYRAVLLKPIPGFDIPEQMSILEYVVRKIKHR